jgi:hypothetical protein
LKIALTADASRAYAVDKLVGSLSLLSAGERGQLSLQYLEDIIPFIVGAIGEDPINTINSMHDVFWLCLGLAPPFLRGGKDPDERQFQIARSIVSQRPQTLPWREEHLSGHGDFIRSFVDHSWEQFEFIARVASLVPEEDFDVAARSVGANNLERDAAFCIGEASARATVARNEQVIDGPFEPMLSESP